MTLPPDIGILSMHALIHISIHAPVKILFIESFITARLLTNFLNYMLNQFLHGDLKNIEDRRNKIIQYIVMIRTVMPIMSMTMREDGRMNIIDAVTTKVSIGITGTAKLTEVKGAEKYHITGIKVYLKAMVIAMRRSVVTMTTRVQSTLCTCMPMRCSVGRRWLVAW